MNEILRDPMWQFIGALITFLAIIITIVISFIQKKRKKLEYEILTTNSLLTYKEEIEGKLQILYEDKPINNLTIIILKLINNGNVPIATDLPPEKCTNNKLVFSYSQALAT